MDINKYIEFFNGLDPEYKQIMAELQAMFSAVGLQLRGRGTHTDGVMAKGTLKVLASRDVPSNSLFVPGEEFKVLFRHANIAGGSNDDTLINGRGAALRLGTTDQSYEELVEPSIQDLVLNTGEVFGLATARLYQQFFKSSFAEKSDMLAANILTRNGVEGALKDPNSFTELYYHTQLCYEWIDGKKQSRYARFRLLSPEQGEEGGQIDENIKTGPRLVLPKKRNETRDPIHLRNEFKNRLDNGGTVEYILQAQFHTMEEQALDCTTPWDSTTYPWLDVAVITLNENITDETLYNKVAYNPAHTHTALKFPASHSADDFASLGMSGALVHYVGALARKKGSQYLYGDIAGLPGKPDYFPLPLGEIPTDKFLFLLKTAVKLPDEVYPPDGDRNKVAALVSFMPATALDLAIGSTRSANIPDDYFIQRRLNGYNPGVIREVPAPENVNGDWTHVITHNLKIYTFKPGLYFPKFVQLRLNVEQGCLTLHSIKIDEEETRCESGSDAWEAAKRVFLQAEFVMQELKQHLARCHFNIVQYVMAIKGNLAPNHPVRRFIDPHLEGLVFINSNAIPKIIGASGFIPLASMLTQESINDIMRSELEKLTYTWDPIKALPTDVPGDIFTPAAKAFWGLLDDYIEQDLLVPHAAELETQANKKQIEALFAELKERNIYTQRAMPNFDPSELATLLKYIIYHSSFLHSWVNFKQYDDAGNAEHVTMGDYSQFEPAKQDLLNFKQRSLTWTLSSVRYNPVMVNGSDVLKGLIKENISKIEPGLPLKDLMMSINI